MYNNTLRDITPRRDDPPMFIIGIESMDPDDPNNNYYTPTQNIHVFNNLIYNTAVPTNTGLPQVYAFGIRGDNTRNIGIYHNTTHNVGALYVHYDNDNGVGNGVSIRNNIFASVPLTYNVIREPDWSAVMGTFTLSHNWFSRSPDVYTNTLFWTGDPLFVNAPTNLRLTMNSPAGDKGMPLTPSITRDFARATRFGAPDLGAFESVNHSYIPMCVQE